MGRMTKPELRPVLTLITCVAVTGFACGISIGRHQWFVASGQALGLLVIGNLLMGEIYKCITRAERAAYKMTDDALLPHLVRLREIDGQLSEISAKMGTLFTSN